MKPAWLLWATAVCFSSTPGATTLLEMVDQEGSRSRLYVEGSRLRLESSDGPEFVLMDAVSGRLEIVSPDEQQVIVMDPGMREQRETRNGAEARFQRLGAGPTIAGFGSQRYRVTVAGAHCGEQFLSQEALRELGSVQVLESMDQMARMGQEDEAMSGGPCEAAGDFSPRYRELGIPLRSLDAEGQLEFEITRLDTNASLPPGGFDAPEAYSRTSMQELMQGAMPAPGAMPGGGAPSADQIEQMRQLMQEMEGMYQSQGLPEAEREELRRDIEEMQRQMQQMMRGRQR